MYVVTQLRYQLVSNAVITIKVLLANCYTWPFSILKAAKLSGRSICQVEQNLERHSYLKSGINPFQQVLQVISFSKSPKTLETTIIATNSP